MSDVPVWAGTFQHSGARLAASAHRLSGPLVLHPSSPTSCVTFGKLLKLSMPVSSSSAK